MTAIRPLLAGAVLGAAALMSTAPARAEEPVVRYPPSAVRPRLIAGGIAVTGVAYGAALLGGESTLTWPGSADLRIPVAGPWIALAQNGCPPEDPGCDALVYLRAGLLVVDGLLQAAGLAIVAEAILMKTEATPAAPPKKTAFSWTPSTGFSFSWKPAPFVTPTAAGFGLVGTF